MFVVRSLAACARGRLFAAVLMVACLPGAGNAATPVPEKHPVVVTRQPAAAATAASVSPYAARARQHAQAASSEAHIASVPPSVRRTRQPVGRQVQH